MGATSREAREKAYAEFVAARQTQLRRLAYALCGDWQHADEVLAAALTKLYVAWPRQQREGTEEAFVRRAILRTEGGPRRRAGAEVAGDDDDQDELFAALLALPVKQRKVVLLHHWLGLSVEETADELGTTAGSVRTQSSRALATLARSTPTREPR